MKFSITGEIDLNGKRKFSKEVDAKTENAAKEKIYALFGSHNNLKRTKVTISSVNKV